MVMGIVSATRMVVGNEGCFRVASGSGRMAGSASLAGSGASAQQVGISTFTAPVGQSFSQGMQYQHSS